MKKNRNEKNEAIKININSLIQNLVIIVSDEKEASETIKQKVTEALKDVIELARQC